MRYLNSIVGKLPIWAQDVIGFLYFQVGFSLGFRYFLIKHSIKNFVRNLPHYLQYVAENVIGWFWLLLAMVGGLLFAVLAGCGEWKDSRKYDENFRGVVPDDWD